MGKSIGKVAQRLRLVQVWHQTFFVTEGLTDVDTSTVLTILSGPVTILTQTTTQAATDVNTWGYSTW
jgi:hypothetical protein